MQVPAIVWIVVVLITIVIVSMSVWVLNKAYSRRWEEDSNEKRGEF